MPQQTDAQVTYRITCQGDDEAEILIYDVIGNSWWEETVTAKQFAKDLRELGNNRKLNVRINSPGGSVFDGTAIYNALAKHKGDVTVNIDGIALSMASVIAMAGDTVRMADNALMMVHNPQGAAFGEAKDLRAYADVMDKAKANLVGAYTKKSGREAQEISDMMDAETWLTAEEALEAGLIDEITEAGETLAAHFDIGTLTASGVKVPKHMRKRLAALVPTSIPQEDDKMANDNKPERVLATVEQLEALKGADEKFVIAQLKAKATLEEATAELANVLAAKLEAANKELDAKNEQLAKASTTDQPKSEGGVAPVNSGSVAGTETGDACKQEAWGDNPHAFFRSEVSKLTASGMTATAASQQVNRRHPGLMKAMQAA